MFFEGKHRRYENSINGIGNFLVIYCKNRGNYTVLEPGGGYERRLLQQLFENEVKVPAVNPYCVRNFEGSAEGPAKTDKIGVLRNEKMPIMRL